MHSPKELFACTELEKALKEEAYGLKGYELLQKSHLESTAKVTLLEGEIITISLTPRGYQFRKEAAEEELTYESIEEALQVASPLYLQAKQRLLVERLSSIAFQSMSLRTE